MLHIFLLSLIETGQTTVTEASGQNGVEQQGGATIESFVENIDVKAFCEGSIDSDGDPIPSVPDIMKMLDEELTKLFMNKSFQALSLLDVAKIAKGGFILSITQAKIKNSSQSLTQHGATRSILHHMTLKKIVMNIMIMFIMTIKLL